MSVTSTFKQKAYFITQLVLGIAAAIALIIFAYNVIFLIFGGILIALLFDGAGQVLRKVVDMPPHASALLAGGLIIAGIGLLSWLLGIQVSNQVGQLGPLITDSLNQLSNNFPSFEPLIEKIRSTQLESFLGTPNGEDIGNITHFLSGTMTVVTNTVFLVFLGFFFAAAPASYRNQALPLFSKKNQENFQRKLEAMGHVLKRWLVANFISMALVGVTTAVGLWALNVPLPLALALIAFLTAFIPNLGPILALIPAVLIAFTVSPMMAVWTFLLYAGIQFIESNIITPNIQHKAVSIAPGFILSSQLLMGALFGFAGLALATPIIAAASVFVKKDSEKKTT